MHHQHRSSAVAVGLAIACVVALSAAVFLATPAAGEARTYVASADVEPTEVLVGDTITITAVVGNVGDSRGANIVEFYRDGRDFTERRVVVDAESRTRETVNITIDQPGTYRFRAGDKRAGTVEVKRTLATVDSADDTSRQLTVRVDGVRGRESYPVEVPPETNRSLWLQQWNVSSSTEEFDQTVVEYTDPSAADVSLPPTEHATVAGVVTTSSSASVESTTARVAVAQSRLTSLGLSPENVSLYAYEGDRWAPVETRVVDRGTGTVVYEGTVPDGGTFAVGSFSPAFSIGDTELDTADDPAGQRIVVTATIENDGAIAGEYEAAMTVNGDQVNETVLTVPAGENRTTSLSWVAPSAGSYDVGLDDRSLGQVQIVGSQVGTPTPGTTATPTATPVPSTETTAGGGSGDGGSGDGVSLPSEIAGYDTQLVIGVGAGVLVFLLIGALLWRSGRSSGGDFDEW